MLVNGKKNNRNVRCSDSRVLNETEVQVIYIFRKLDREKKNDILRFLNALMNSK